MRKINCMRYIYFVLLAASIFSSCKKGNDANGSNQIQWNKIIIKGEIAVGAMYGNIFDQLIIGTNQNILKTVDTGKTWRTVASNVDQIREFTTNGDTLIAISDGKDYFSLDYGNNWQLLVYDRVRINSNQVITSNSHIYKIVYHSEGEDARPTEVLFSSDQGFSWQNVFPFKHDIFTVYIDKQDKIYLGVFGLSWSESQRTFLSLKNPEDAIIYYTKGN